MHKICTKPAYMALQANERTNKNGHLTVFLFIFQRMNFSRLEWGIDAKGSGGRKAKKIPHSKAKSTSAVISQRVWRICKARWGRNATWGAIAKVGSNRKEWGQIAKGRAETRPDALSIFLSLQEIKA